MKNKHNFLIKMRLCAAMVFLLASVGYGLAADNSQLIEGAKLCTNYLPRQERQYGIPVHLLAAIATAESGRYHSQLGLSLPWPWTINVEGKGYFYDTKEEAVAAVKEFHERGIKSIDVGCMQVNLHHHPTAFSSVEEAFDPAYNIAYAAQFLKKNFEEEGSWRKATADYHSHTPVFGEPYAGMVFNHWSRIINKVADARAGKLVLRAEPAKNTVNYTENTSAKTHDSYHALHMHSVLVGSGTTHENGVTIIRPDKNPVQLANANSRFDDKFVIQIVHKQPEKEEKAADTHKEEKPARAKGQFEPGNARMIHIGTTGNATGDAQPAQNKTFVFN